MSHPHALAELTPADIAEAVGLPAPTDEQAAVISGPLEPTLVVAGAGAGKTETMAARVVYLVATGQARPSNILGLTFTRKAAQQLRRRVRQRLEVFARSSLCQGTEGRRIAELIRTEDPRVATYDSYAGDILASYGLFIPVEPDVRLVDDTQRYLLARSVVEEWDAEFEHTLGTVTKRVLELGEQISSHLLTTDDIRKDDGLLQELVHALGPGPRQKSTGPNTTLQGWERAQLRRLELLDVVDAVNERMHAEGLVTFGQRMAYAARLAHEFPQVAESERRLTSVVLLDEYQDTGQAQRIMLSGLYGGGERPPLAVTAVGDPMQSIYGWRGASASNLSAFLTDFPAEPERAAGQLTLSTSWRNPPEVLDLANGLTAELRRASQRTKVPSLKPREGSGSGDVRLAVHETITEERQWLARSVAETYRALERDTGSAPTAAVLIRKRADAVPLARALESEGLEVEIVATSGLLEVPEVADALALLRIAVDPGDDESSIRLLCGDRYRLGAADLAALARRARDLSVSPSTAGANDSPDLADEADFRAQLGALSGTENVDTAGLADAAHRPGAASEYTQAGRSAIAAFDSAVQAVRDRIDSGPAQALACAEAELGLGVETRLRALLGRGEGRQQLDAIESYAAQFASRPDADVATFLDYLRVAKEVERGLEQEVEPKPGRVQILTVHAAKGLEWQIVAVPHVVKNGFPSGNSISHWVTSEAQLPVHLRGDAAGETNPDGVPVPELLDCADRKELEVAVNEHIDALKKGNLDEETRLFYVAITRSEKYLFVSGHHWAQKTTPVGPSDFLRDLHRLGTDRKSFVRAEPWSEEPESDDSPVVEIITSAWPEVTEDRRPRDDGSCGATQSAASSAARVRVAAAAVDAAEALNVELDGDLPVPDLVADALAHVETDSGGDEAGPVDPAVRSWIEETVVHLRHARRRQQADTVVEIPARLTATQHVALERDPAGFAANVLRPMPQKPNPFARRGTAFHTWVENHFSHAEQFLFDEDDLPGSGDEGWEESTLKDLQSRFLESHWAAREAVAVEVPFAIRIGGQTKVGKMDAVFRDGDGWVIVDWKTGSPPGAELDPSSATARKQRRDVALQLAIYRIAWARLMEERSGKPVPLESIRCAFHYIGSGEDVFPEALPSEAELAESFRRRFSTAVEIAGPETEAAAGAAPGPRTEPDREHAEKG